MQHLLQHPAAAATLAGLVVVLFYHTNRSQFWLLVGSLATVLAVIAFVVYKGQWPREAPLMVLLLPGVLPLLLTALLFETLGDRASTRFMAVWGTLAVLTAIGVQRLALMFGLALGSA